MAKQVLLVGLIHPGQSHHVVTDHLFELNDLVRTLGYQAVGEFIVSLPRIEPAAYLGKGKLEELKNQIARLSPDRLIFDDDLSPTQSRNLEKLLRIEVGSRSEIILEIFARHAHTREAKTQVELATLEYQLPRLARRWRHLERQVGGTRMRSGAGEKQIEIDRRLIRQRIAHLRKELLRIDRERDVQRKGREGFYQVALVGYTNAGKSTLMNLFTNSSIQVADKLFATLDTTVRIWKINQYHKILLSDTVGFIRKLPPHLVASFRSTLQEVRQADLIIKVVDISNPFCLEHLETVDEILTQLNLFPKPSLTVFNKIDRMNENIYQQVIRDYPEAVYLSALKQLKVDDLPTRILAKLQEEEQQISLKLPLDQVKPIALIRDNSWVLNEVYEDGSVQLEFLCYQRVWNWLQQVLKQELACENQSLPLV
jgi:GTP-binding protein HflX